MPLWGWCFEKYWQKSQCLDINQKVAPRACADPPLWATWIEPFAARFWAGCLQSLRRANWSSCIFEARREICSSWAALEADATPTCQCGSINWEWVCVSFIMVCNFDMLKSSHLMPFFPPRVTRTILMWSYMQRTNKSKAWPSKGYSIAAQQHYKFKVNRISRLKCGLKLLSAED